MECPICEYPHVQPHYRLGDRFFGATDEEFVLFRCASCGLLYQKDSDIEGRLDEFYPTGYWWRPEGSTGKLEARYREWMARRDQLNFVRSAIPRGKLIDIGCGSGTFVAQALRADFDAYGLDSSQEAFSLAREAAPGRIFQGDEETLIQKEESFQIVTLFHTLEHIPRPFAYLKKLQKLLKTPGHLFVQVPNRDSLQARLFGARWYGLDCPRHVYNYTTFSLLHLLGRAGYTSRGVRHFSLRDNAAAMASSLAPGLDPMSARVRALNRGRRPGAAGRMLRNAAYFSVMMASQPMAWLEAALKRGGTVTVWASLD